MSKEKKPVTRQVRIYEDDAKLVELILATKDRNTTFADVIRPALHGYYKTLAKRLTAMLDDIEDSVPDENQTKPEA